MSMCGVYNDNVYICLNKCIYTCKNVSCDTNGCTAEQTSLCVLGCKWLFDLFLDILDRDQTF